MHAARSSQAEAVLGRCQAACPVLAPAPPGESIPGTASGGLAAAGAKLARPKHPWDGVRRPARCRRQAPQRTTHTKSLTLMLLLSRPWLLGWLADRYGGEGGRGMRQGSMQAGRHAWQAGQAGACRQAGAGRGMQTGGTGRQGRLQGTREGMQCYIGNRTGREGGGRIRQFVGGWLGVGSQGQVSAYEALGPVCVPHICGATLSCRAWQQ